LLFLYIGHGGSDGLHGYVPSLDHVVADTVSLVGILTNFEEPFTLNSMLQKLFGFIMQVLDWLSTGVVKKCD
jgi:hypothetical protein